MICSLVETLNFIEPYVPSQLVTPQVLAHIKMIANVLPDAMSAYFLECRLGDHNPQVDFLTCATVSDGGRQVLAGLNAAVALPDILFSDPLWDRIRNFWEHWADPASPLYEEIPLTWLEFDRVDEPPSSIPLPCPTFCLDREISQRRNQRHASPSLDPQKYQRVAEITLEHLLGQPLPLQTKKNLFACFDLLPEGGRIIHIGSMQTRQPPILKVYGLVPKDHLLTYLAGIGWPGSLAEIEKIMTTFGPTTPIARPDLTIGDTILPRIGLEFSHPTSPQNNQEQQLVLDHCVASGLCTPEKREALLTWPGSSRETFSQTSWPIRLRRWIDLKIVYQSDQPLEAKAYLGFRPGFSLF